jgi:NTP pyrophosphatase (non-canonical NTP hydrolase)
MGSYGEVRRYCYRIEYMGQIKMNDDLREVMLILQEECAEVTQAISKCFRFGPDQLKPGKERTNINMLEEEIGDLMAMIELLTDLNVGVTVEGIQQAKLKKFEKLKQWSNLTINK